MSEIRKVIRKIVKETYERRVVLYSAVVIEDPAEEKKIKDFSEKYIPEGWSGPAHYHMTINGGPIPESLRLRGDLNKEVELTIGTIGISDKAIAFGTFGYYSKNDMPHITISFNKENGGLPADSKEIENWEPIEKFKVTGVIREIGEGNVVLDESNWQQSNMRNVVPPQYPGFPDPKDYDSAGNRLDDISR